MKFALLPRLLAGCGNCGDSKTFLPHPCGPRQANEPFFKERYISGAYPHSVASLNGEFYIVGFTHHITRTAK